MRANRIKSSIPYVSLLVAIITACALIWNGHLTRKHYELIVKPMVLAEVTSSPLNGKLGIYLKNEGAGPAEINYKSVTLDGHTVSIFDAASQMLKEGIISSDSGVSVRDLNTGSYLKEGAEKSILVIDPKSVVQAAKFDDFIHCRINISYQWCSLYDECVDSDTAKQCAP